MKKLLMILTLMSTTAFADCTTIDAVKVCCQSETPTKFIEPPPPPPPDIVDVPPALPAIGGKVYTATPSTIASILKNTDAEMTIVLKDGQYGVVNYAGKPTQKLKIIAEHKVFSSLESKTLTKKDLNLNGARVLSMRLTGLAASLVEGINFTDPVNKNGNNRLWLDTTAYAMAKNNRCGEWTETCVVTVRNKVTVVEGNWVYSVIYGGQAGPNDPWMDYGFRAYGDFTHTDKAYFLNNLIEGDYHQPLSLKESLGFTYIEGNYFYGDNGKVQNKGSNVILGQPMDLTKDYTVGTVYVRNNLFLQPKGNAVQAGNVEKVYVEGNTFTKAHRALMTQIYSQASGTRILGPVHPTLVEFRNNTIFDATTEIVLVGRGSMDKVLLENNKTPSPLRLETWLKRFTSTGQFTNQPPKVELGAASGFAAPIVNNKPYPSML